jgi:hypothetical protein
MSFNHVPRPERQWVRVGYGRVVSHGPAMLVAVATILLSGRLFRLISRYAVNIFFWDEWDNKTATLFQRNSLWQMFTWQRGWHRLGLGALLEKALDPWFQWNSRSESFILGGIVAVAAICALWLKFRLYGRLSVWDIAIPAIFFTPAQWETLYMTPIFSQGPLPFLLIVLYCLAWTCKTSAVRYTLVLVINFVTIFTGFGIFLGVLTPVLLALDYWSYPASKRSKIGYFISRFLIAFGSLGYFFVGYVRTAGVDCLPHFQGSSLKDYATFLMLMAADFFAPNGRGFFARAAGIALLIGLVISLICGVRFLLRRKEISVSRHEQTTRVVVVALAAVSLATCVTIAYLRLCAGLEVALAPRYTVYIQIGLLGLYFHLLGIREPWTRRSLLSVLVVFVVIACLHADRIGMVHFRDGKQRWKECYLQSEDIEHCNETTGFLIYRLPGGYPRVDEKRQNLTLQEKLQYLKRTRQNLYLDAK